MGPLRILVCPCFGENVIVTCKIVSFLRSLDNFVLKNVIVFFLEIKFQNGAHLRKKKAILNYFSPFLVTREKTKKLLLAYIHTRILLTLLNFFALPIW